MCQPPQEAPLPKESGVIAIPTQATTSTQINSPQESTTEEEDEDGQDNNEDEDGDDGDDEEDGDAGHTGGDGGGHDNDDDDDGGLVLGFPVIILPGIPLPKPPFGPPPPPPPVPPPRPPPPKGQEDPEDGNNEEDEEPTKSCTASVTVTAHCGNHCVLSPISTTGSTTYTTSCATASCTPTVICNEDVPTTTITSFSTQTIDPTSVCEPDSCLACGENGWAKSHEHPPGSDDGFHNDDLEDDDPPAFDAEMNRLRVRQLDQMMSILQPELTSPETWEDGPEIWWGQMLAMVENKGARSRHESVRLANGLRENRGLSSMDFSRFRSRGDAGGAGPIWGCTVVIIATDKGIWTSHHWEEPNFILRENIHKWPNTNSDREFRRQVLEFLANGELRRPGSSEKLYRGINDLRRYLIRDRKFLYVRIITPSRVEMGDAWFPERVWRLGEHLAELLGVDTDEITTFTYEKGLHPAGRDMPHGMVTWQYAPATPVEWGDGNWVNSRVLRVRFQDEILLTHVWCAPNTNAPPAPRAIRGRQEILTSGIATSMPAPTNAISIGRPLTCPADTDLPCSPEFCGCDDMDAPEATPPIKRRQVDSDSEDSEDSEDSNDEESDEEVSIFVNGFSTPESFPADLGGADEWWRQMRAAVAQSNSALRSIRWQREDGSLIGRGYTSSDFTWFGEWPGGGGTGPMWGCTAVVIMTNNGIFVSHHWEDPNFMMMAGAGNWPPGTTTEGAFRQYVLNWLLSGEQAAGAQYYGINDLREELINMRNWIDVIIITPHSSRHGGWRLDSNIPYYPQKIDQLRRHLATTLRIERRAIRLLTYPKGRGHWSTPARRWDGILSWQYAPRTPVRPGGRGLFIEARGIRLRWGRDIVTQRVWCIPGTEDQLPTGTRLAARQETTTGNTEIQTRTAEEWMTGTATPTNGIDVDDLVCELPPWTSSTTSTPTTITSVEEEDKPSATAKPTTFPSPTLTVWLTMQPDVGDETPSEAPIFLSDWPFVTTTTTRREAAPKVTSTTSTSTGREAAPKFTTSTASTTTSREAAPKITGTVEYYFDHTLQVWKESNLMFFDLKVYQRGRSIDEIGEGDEKPYNYYGMFSFRDMERPYESSAIQLSNEAPQAMRLLPGEFSVIITPGDGDDEYSIQYNWLEQKWDTDSTRECTHEGAKGDSVSGEYYSERRYCTWHVELWGDDGICTLHPDHKDCKREE